MHMKHKLIRSPIIIVFASIILTHVSCEQAKDAINEDIQILRSCGSETIYFAHAPVFEPFWDKKVNGQSTSFLLAPFGATAAALDKVGIWNQTKQFNYLILGAKDFRSPRALGPVKSDMLCIIGLSASLPKNLNSVFSASPAQFLGEHPVWKWQIQIDESGNPWTFFIMQPNSQKLYVSTSLELLKEGVSQQRRDLGTVKSPEWQFVDLNRPIWAIRHYNHSTTERVAAGLEFGGYRVGTDAVGLTISFDPQENSIIVRYLSLGNDAGLLSFWAKKDRLAYRMIDTGVWETTFKINTDEASVERQFRLIGMLGFGVYL